MFLKQRHLDNISAYYSDKYYVAVNGCAVRPLQSIWCLAHLVVYNSLVVCAPPMKKAFEPHWMHTFQAMGQ